MKIAICLSGAMSKLGNRFIAPDSLYNNSPYINFNICFNSTKKHIIEANANCKFDFFIHSWNLDLKNDLEKLYCPIKSSFEDNLIYKEEINKKIKSNEDYAGISKSLSMQKSIKLLEEYNSNYDLIMIYRPDILLLKNIIFNKYDLNRIYVNTYANGQGDFHFIMNYENLKKFKYLYNSIEQGNLHKTHFWIKNYVNNFMCQDLVEDEIIAGQDQEVLRKVSDKINTTINPEVLLQYGSK
jgi:hypothetical protein